MAESVDLEPDGTTIQFDLDVSALSEQTMLDLLRRMGDTKARQQEIGKTLEEAEEKLWVAHQLLINAKNLALDPGHQARLREYADLALALVRKVGEAYEPSRIRKPWERYE